MSTGFYMLQFILRLDTGNACSIIICAWKGHFMELKQIGTIYTDFPEKFGIPRQSGLVDGLIGRIEFLPAYRNRDTVRGLDGYSHIWLLWGFSEVHKFNWTATVTPPRLGGHVKMGVFATRSPYRPNPIGLSSVRLEEVLFDEKLGPILTVSGVDMLSGTPIYDIKPYLPYIDCHQDAVGGFTEKTKDHSLDVVFPENLLSKLPAEHHSTVIALIKQDPRTAFIHDESREWGVAYAGYNIRFTVKDMTATVCEVELYDDWRGKNN